MLGPPGLDPCPERRPAGGPDLRPAGGGSGTDATGPGAPAAREARPGL